MLSEKLPKLNFIYRARNSARNNGLWFLLFILTALTPFQNCSNSDFKIVTALEQSTEVLPNGTRIVRKSTDLIVSNQVDILFVGDNSGSMREEQAEIANKFANFINIVSGIDFRLAITTTDVGDQGRLINFPQGGNYLSSANMDLIAIAQNFSTAIQLGTEGSADERGIATTAMAIRNNTNMESQIWMRRNAHLAVILFSDENERSTGENLQPDDMPENLIQTIRDHQGENKSVKFHSIIISPNDSVCLAQQNSSDVRRYGTIYAEASNLTGGLIGDICAASYTEQLVSLAQDIQVSADSLELGCKPYMDQSHGVQVYLNNTLVNQSMFRVEGSKVIFNSQLSIGSKIGATYYCEE